MILAPSILSADFAALGNDIEIAEAAGAKWLHIDVMDGIFVPSISFGMPVLSCVRKISKTFLDVHLMITEPIRYIEDFVNAGADGITIHIEACENVAETLALIKSFKIKAGISINPDTHIDKLLPYLADVDLVLIMTVNPGFGGQQYIDACTAKISAARRLINEQNSDILLEVDGGVKLSNLSKVIAAGAEVIVAGSAIFHGDIAKNTSEFIKIMKGTSP